MEDALSFFAGSFSGVCCDDCDSALLFLIRTSLMVSFLDDVDAIVTSAIDDEVDFKQETEDEGLALELEPASIMLFAAVECCFAIFFRAARDSSEIQGGGRLL